MKKFAKASIATAAGITLLLGGAGTFATWNASADAASGASITAGNLVIEDATAGAWTDAKGAPVNLATYKVVPGDSLTFQQTYTVTAEGDALTAELGITEASITSTGGAASDALAVALVKTAEVTADGSAVTAGSRQVVQQGATIAIKAGTADVTVRAKITFPDNGVGADNTAMTGSVDLSKFKVTLTQVIN